MAALDGIILDDIKKLLGMNPEYDAFDLDTIIGINTVFSNLQQLGVGPREAFQLLDNTETWGEFFATTTVPSNFSFVKSYVFMKVKMMFDPPSVGYAVTAMEKQILELEWRLNVQAEGAFDG